MLFDYNSGGITISVDGAVPFNQAPFIVGTAISKNNNTTFMVNQNGTYTTKLYLTNGGRFAVSERASAGEQCRGGADGSAGRCWH